jgi:hypothetical protein
VPSASAPAERPKFVIATATLFVVATATLFVVASGAKRSRTPDGPLLHRFTRFAGKSRVGFTPH